MAEPWSDGDVLTAAQLAGLPWGVMGYATKTANQSGISTITDVTSLSVTFTAISSRLYETLAMFPLQQLTSGGFAVLALADGASTQLGAAFMTLATNDFGTLNLCYYETGISGSTTRKLRASTSAGTTTILSGTGQPGFICVKDIGPG